MIVWNLITNRETQRMKGDRFLPISILVAAVLIGGAVVFAFSFYKGGGSAAPSGGAAKGTTSQQGAPAVSAATILKSEPGDAVTGSANAPVTVTEYGDYQCPFCGEFFSQIEPTIMTQYVTPGKVKFVSETMLSWVLSLRLPGQLADCAADQNQQFAYHNALYTAKVADVAGVVMGTTDFSLQPLSSSWLNSSA